MSDEIKIPTESRGFALGKTATKTESDVAMTGSFIDVLLLDVESMTGFQEITVFNTHASNSISYEILATPDQNMTESDFAATDNTSKTVRTLQASTALAAAAAPNHTASKVITSGLKWVKLRLNAAAGTTYIACFRGI